ncbi:MAG: type II toxin-antitoxin system HicA family toxin [Phycisphaerales bacterium]|nr:type II toxin-antitoxin system HicA family toxin [Phycisphaerales bacterium]
MRLPRDISGPHLAQALGRLGYTIDHQRGSHVRLTTQRGGEHHITIPAHDPIKVGTLNAILRDVGEHAGLERTELLRVLFG